MSRYIRTLERGRHTTPLPPERRAEQPFIFEPKSRSIIAPWARTEQALPSDDQARLEQVAKRIASLDPLPRGAVWMWPDRGPVAIEIGSRTWLVNWSRDRACYSFTAKASVG